jgi:hypothetical protein
MLAIVFDFLLQPPLVKSVFKTGHNRTFSKRLDKIVVRSRAHGFDAHVHVIYTGGNEEGHVGVLVTNFGEQLHAAKARHLKIRNDRVEGLAL